MKKIFLGMLCCMFVMLVHAQNPFVAKTIQDKALWQPWGSNPQYIDLDAIYHKEQSGFANITLYVAENIGNYRFLEPTTLKYSSTEQISGNNFIYGDYNAFITYITSVPTYVNIEKVTNIKYYPNPTTGELYIQLEDYTAEKQIALQITDISGKTIRSEVRQLNESNTLRTDISDLSSGVYLVHLTANGVLVGTAKVVVE
ncbi:MAG: T9SS type A sorting domain-containing protein [Chitinophagales bacterium]|nr:T9SS type A sorting domain-containing protein [Chitinophagales bacterium]